MATYPQVSQGCPRGVAGQLRSFPSGLHHFSFFSPGWSRPRGGALQALLFKAKGQPLIALAKSLVFGFFFPDFVQVCKDSKEEELEELPQVRVERRQKLGEGSCWHGRQRERGAPGSMEIRGRTLGESSVAS